MVYLQSEIKRGFLRQIVEGSKKAGCTLRNSLLAFQAAIATDSFKLGKILISTSGSGQSGSFEIGVVGKQFTPENVFALSEEFLATLDAIIADGAVDGTTAEALDVLFTTMSGQMRGVRSQMGDFSCLNV